jgi:hypothetical protein
MKPGRYKPQHRNRKDGYRQQNQHGINLFRPIEFSVPFHGSASQLWAEILPKRQRSGLSGNSGRRKAYV